MLETPFTDAGQIDEVGFDELTRHVLTTGVEGVMFPGYASESLKLADEERTTLISQLLALTRSCPDVVAVISVSDHATRLAVEHAEWAAHEGADAINVLPPYLLGVSSTDVVEHLRCVAVAVDPLPVIVQFAPAQTGTTLGAVDLVDLAARQPNIAAVKVEANPPGRLVSALASASPSLPALVGYAGIHLPDSVRRGAVGVQPGCSFVELYVELWRRWSTADERGFDLLHARMLPFLSMWMQHVELIVQAEKTISMLRGLISSDACRAPGYRMDDHERASVLRFLAEFPALTEAK